MFKTAATKIAHNSTIPALAGNHPLQVLIKAEKAVLMSLQKLSVDFSKASQALRGWGLSEGDDLGDILGASTAVLNHFSAALSQYATHGLGIRKLLKAIRTRKEGLDLMKRRRRAVFRKAEDANQTLNQMSPQHKNINSQTDLLNRLRGELKTLDTEIMVEEAALGDFKRTATRMFMGLKFGGLLECCQKGSIAATFGNLVISEISEEQTQPGFHRASYHGHEITEACVEEAREALQDVTISAIPALGFRDRQQYYGQLPSRVPSPTNMPIEDTGQSRSASSSSSDDCDISSPSLWLQRVRHLADNSSRLMKGLTIYVGPDQSDPDTFAAQAFLDTLLTYHRGSPLEPSAILTLFNYEELAIGERKAEIGEAVGSGPIRAIYERALSLFTADASVWKPSRNDAFTWNVRTIPTNPFRLAKARTAGTLMALGYTWFAQSFHPISFWLSALCVTATTDKLNSIDVIDQVDQDLGDSLRAWPMDPDIPLISSPPLTILLANYLNTTYPNIQNCGAEERLQYRDELFAQALFQTSASSIQTDPELQAMREAFNITLTSTIRLREMFGGAPLKLLVKMYGQLLQSAETLIQHLNFPPLSLPSRFTEDDLDAFRIKLARYFRGIGHPSNLPKNVLPSAMRREKAKDRLYRARRFLKCSTASSIIPTNPRWQVTIRLTDQVPGEFEVQQPVNAGVNWQPEVPGFIFHTCSQDALVCYSPDLKGYLQMEDPDNDSDPTPFDAWVHQSLIESQDGDGWNIR